MGQDFSHDLVFVMYPVLPSMSFLSSKQGCLCFFLGKHLGMTGETLGNYYSYFLHRLGFAGFVAVFGFKSFGEVGDGH